MTRLLASVRDDAEALLALEGGADIVDFKDPSHGALGALLPQVIACGVDRLAGRVVTSATAGDWPLDAPALEAAVRRIGATGVDYVKLGLLPGDGLGACVAALAPVARAHPLVAVFFADRGVPSAAIARLREAGFAGAMIDTFDKRAGGLRRHLDDDRLADFVRRTRAASLMSGLAGALSTDDIPALAAIGPDLIGFRGALCERDRAATLSLERMRAVRAALDRALASANVYSSASR